jgi:NAD(P)-dependent dehydrogenase (short-subunit alcohol dehydrogenase family)
MPTRRPPFDRLGVVSYYNIVVLYWEAGATLDREKLRRLHDLSNRVAIVTGGTRGIGLAIAEGFVAAGAKVAVASRKSEACAEAEARLRALGGEAIGVASHMGDIDAIGALVGRTADAFGRLDIVVNNAANALTRPFGELTGVDRRCSNAR